GPAHACRPRRRAEADRQPLADPASDARPDARRDGPPRRCRQRVLGEPGETAPDRDRVHRPPVRPLAAMEIKPGTDVRQVVDSAMRAQPEWNALPLATRESLAQSLGSIAGQLAPPVPP